MSKNILLFFVGAVVLKKVTTQSVDYITTTPIAIQDTTCDTNWENLIPTLKLVKRTSHMNKERLLNVVKIIKVLLSDETEQNQCDNILKEYKTNELSTPVLTDFDSIVDERLKPITEAIDGKTSITNDDDDEQNDVSENKTEDVSKILDDISAALAKLEEDREKDKESQNSSEFVGMFRSGSNACKNNLDPPLFKNLGQIPKQLPKQAELNSNTIETKFNIPCQRAADILKETSSVVIPKEAYCELRKNINLNSILSDPRLNSDNLPFKVVPNSVSCVDGDDSVAILFKPKKISLMQVYGNLLKKITITVLVPYHVAKMGL